MLLSHYANFDRVVHVSIHTRYESCMFILTFVFIFLNNSVNKLRVAFRDRLLTRSFIQYAIDLIFKNVKCL